MLVEAVEAFGVLLAHGRQDERAEEGKPDLAAVGVAGEHQVDEVAARVGDDVVGVVGFVRHEDDGAVGFGGEGEVEVGVAGTGVVRPQSQRRPPLRSIGTYWLTRTGVPWVVRAWTTAGALKETSWLPRMA